MGPSAAYKVEGLGDGVPASGGAEGRGQGQLSSLCSAPTMPFTSHAGGAEEAPAESKPWCIDRGDFLEAMSTVTLWRALELGELPHSTRVWREGLECWTPAGDVKALGWTISQPPPRDEAPALSAAGEAPESTGPLSFALTPDDLSSVAPRFHQDAPAKARGERAEAFTLGRFPLAEAVLRRDSPSQPISLDIPSCFPAAPSSPPDTLPSAVAPRPGAAKPGLGPARGARDADPTPRGRVSGAWSRLARRARVSRGAAGAAAGSAALVLVLGLSVLSVVAPGASPARPAAAQAAHLGVAQGVATAAAQVAVPAPDLAASAGAAALAVAAPARDGTAVAAPARDGAAVATPARDGATAEAAPARDGATADATLAREEAAATPGEDTGAPALPLHRAEKASASGAKPAPAGRRERGQFRLRRGRSEADATRGISYPARRADSWLGTGAILRDSR
ncbi:hypothetical protein predicted by Glimmer/Critica [Sorangium cellulosum So ce56]|uniref:GYF domain-containing protein n=1 Tax=Sorangium cellulosum (strain So ce56) TaxID=448385 RepID=A9FFY1_SORC5|nr:hypothetical protein [Sorangium cellulosum]CAN98066.1 hypothetical protein predicted by Glimmer/Critica [Sorangium cellulosum So ce56]